MGFVRLLLAAIAVSAMVVEGQKDMVLDLVPFTNNMNQHFTYFNKPRHPKDEDRSAWLASRTYIETSFQYYGLDVQLQCFNTSVQIEYDVNKDVEGCNVIGVHYAESQKFKNIFVVGAHYDSSGEKKNYNALRDNGVGVSTLLETARAFMESVKWKGFMVNFTTVFVAFDLNTKEQYPESPGKPGSQFFVNDWLEPLTLTQRSPIKGAYILDSIATYNTESDSQVLPADFQTYFPEAYTRIKNSTNKGDFLAVISNQASKKLVDEYSGYYRKSRRAYPYRLQEMVAGEKGFGAAGTMRMVNHQATYHFWIAKPPMPAALLTDTDDNRVLPAGEVCDFDCNFLFSNAQRMQFVLSTYQALSRALLDSQTTYVGLSGASDVSVSCFTVILSVALAHLLVRQ